MKASFSWKLSLFFIIIIAAFFRLNNVNWDNNQHLHPDERFLTMVGTAMKIPTSFGEYMDPKKSQLNPSNLNFKYFVYGVFPLVLNKILAVNLKTDDYNNYALQGRMLSASFDIITVMFVYLIGCELVKLQRRQHPEKELPEYAQTLPLWAAFFYAICVLPIQLSHFFAVDTFLTTFMLGSFYFTLRSYVELVDTHVVRWKILYSKIIILLLLSSALNGIGLACKVNAIFMVPLNLALIVISQVWFVEKHFRAHKVFARLIPFISAILYVVIAYLSLRVGDPYKFASSDFLDFTLSQDYINSLTTLSTLYKDNEVWFPPAIQFMSKTRFVFSFINHFVFGLSVPLSILFFIGLGASIRTVFLKYKEWKWATVIVLMTGWLLSLFLSQSAMFMAVMRYFIYFYPFFAIVAAYGFLFIIQLFARKWKKSVPIVISVLTVILLIWPVMFSSIYIYKHTRLQASEWIYTHFPRGTVLLHEHWDDPLPLILEPWADIQYVHKELPVFEADTPAKWVKMRTALDESEYYILSSNRAWGSIMPVPWKYPQTSQFYKDLLAGRTQYVKIKEFSSFPSLRPFGIPFEIPDEIADEAFSVYDHPKVMIFKNVKKK